MAKSKRERAGQRTRFTELLRPDYLVFCEYALIGQDNGVSLIKLIDQANTAGLPVTLSRFTVVAEFARLPQAKLAAFHAAKPLLKVELQNPAGKIIDLGEYAVSDISEDNLWNVHRLVLDMSMGIKFTIEGTYVFRVLAKTTGTDFEQVLEKSLPISIGPGPEPDDT